MTFDTGEQSILRSVLQIAAGSQSLFSDWQARYHERIVSFKGFISLEISRPTEGEDSVWEITQRFDRPDRLNAWVNSGDRHALMEELRSFGGEGKDVLVTERFSRLSEEEQGVVEVIVTEVNPAYADAYRAWIGKIHAAESKFPGFRKVYIQSPSRKEGRSWVTFLQFDNARNLDRWLDSPERKEILQESESFVEKIESHRVVSSFAGWFADRSGLNAIPPVWKQTMLVLLVLFPIVMVELKYLSPLLTGFNSSVATFIGNAISVSLISWPMMPVCIRCLRWWLNPQGNNSGTITFFGTLFICLLYGFEVLLFLRFL